MSEAARGAPPNNDDRIPTAPVRHPGDAPRTRSSRALARPELLGVPLYEPDQTACAVDVSDNTNLWGMPPAASRALREAAASASRYPSLYGAPLKAALHHYLGLPGAGVVTGCGSDDVLDAAMRAFGARGDTIAFSAPTFSMIPTFARLNGLAPRAVPLRDDWSIDPERLVATDAKLIYLCAPNNPTATGIARAAVEHVVRHAPGIVILDEAYAEFAPATHADLVAHSERLLVTRTLSKAFGLAGLRVGYGVGAPALVQLVERARGPYKVSVLAERAALAALAPGDDALGWVQRHAALARTNRDRLLGELRQRGFAPAPSEGNFVFVPTARARGLAEAMRTRGVLVRLHTGLPTDVAALREARGEALRIGVGPWETMETVLAALDEAAAAGSAR